MENTKPLENNNVAAFLEKPVTISSLPPASPRRKNILIGVLLIFFLLSGYGLYTLSYPKGGPISPLGNKPGSDDVVVSGENAMESEKGTVENPINGLLYTEEQAKIWQDRRPLAVMVNNHPDARPQSGLAQADLVFEVNAEGGIPRLMPIFLSKNPEKVGSVRSVRAYFVDFAKEYNAWLAHWGGAQYDPNLPLVADPASDAYDRMRKIFVSSIDETKNGDGNGTFWREEKPGLAGEHSGYASVPKLYEMGYALYPDQKKDFQPIKPWVFKDEAKSADRPQASSAAFNFWNFADYAVRWEYNQEQNTYKRFQGGVAHLDMATGKQLEAKNVILQIMRETAFNDQKHHLNYNPVGSGKAEILLDGRVTEAVWRRAKIEERTRFYSTGTGDEIAFNRGQIWIEIVPEGSEIILTP